MALLDQIAGFVGTQVCILLGPLNDLNVCSKDIVYDADRLFIMVNGQNPRAEATFRKLCRSEVWKGLNIVRNRNVHKVSYDKW